MSLSQTGFFTEIKETSPHYNLPKAKRINAYLFLRHVREVKSKQSRTGFELSSSPFSQAIPDMPRKHFLMT